MPPRSAALALFPFLFLSLYSPLRKKLCNQKSKTSHLPLFLSPQQTPSTLSTLSLLLLLQLLQKVRLVDKHHLPPVRVRRRADLGPDPRDGPGLAGDSSAGGPDLFGGLVHVFRRDRDLGVARALEVFVLGLAPELGFFFISFMYSSLIEWERKKQKGKREVLMEAESPESRRWGKKKSTE